MFLLQESSVWDRLVDSRNIFWLFVVLCVAIPVISTQWFAYLKVKSNNDLKRRMVEQGLSPEEIERVLAAGESGATQPGRRTSTPDARHET